MSDRVSADFKDGQPRCRTRDISNLLGWHLHEVDARLQAARVTYTRKRGDASGWITKGHVQRLLRIEISIAYGAKLADRVMKLRQVERDVMGWFDNTETAAESVRAHATRRQTTSRDA